MLDVESFLKLFVQHFQSCSSSRFILKMNASFESWFRAEIPMTLENWYELSEIDTNFSYPNKTTKADLVINSKNETIVFELKPFVIKQDANKKNEYPKQIKSLETIVEEDYCTQGIAFTTFKGYSEKQISTMLDRFFSNPKWKVYRTNVDNSDFVFHVGSYSK